MSRTEFRIDDMCCPSEEQMVRNCLRPIHGISNLDFDFLNRKLVVDHTLEDPQPIASAISTAGLSVVMVGGEDHDYDHHHAASRAEIVVMAISGVLAAAAEVVAWTTGAEQSWPVIALALGSIALGGRETIKKGILSIQTFSLNINFLMTLAIIGAMAIGSWPEAAMVTFLFGVAEMIEAASMERARNAIQSLMDLKPLTALAQTAEGTWAEVAASEVRVGQLIRVRPGEKIALDGQILSGTSTVDQSPITGESIPVEKGVGDQVFAGTLNERGTFDFEVAFAGNDTTLSRIIRAVEQAQSERAPTQRFIDRFAKIYTPVVVLLAVLVAAIPPVFFGEPFQPWLYKALVLLVIACPCALVISTPVTIVSALAAAARKGILVKGGVYMEEGRKLSVIALDKTGTITHGKPSLTDIIPLGDESADNVIELAAALDAPSEHPVATAIVAASKSTPIPVEGFESLTGRGVSGTLGGKRYFLGNHRLAHDQGYCSPEVEAHLERLEEEGKSVVILGHGGKALGILAVADTIRETSVQAVAELHELGVKTLMLTGDNDRTARAIASQVGIDDARGDLLPEDKLRAIEGLADSGKHVGMVGDGINDAPALAKSNIGFAMGVAGTDTAIETADVALMKDDLRKLPEFIRLSRKAGNVLTQNIALAVGIKAIFFALAFANVATLWMAVFADLGGSLLVVANGLRLLQGTKRQG